MQQHLHTMLAGLAQGDAAHLVLRQAVMPCCRLAEGTRKAVEGWGMKLLCKESRWNSDSLTVIETPQVCPGHPFAACGSHCCSVLLSGLSAA